VDPVDPDSDPDPQHLSTDQDADQEPDERDVHLRTVRVSYGMD
jgi:hypothetical protein